MCGICGVDTRELTRILREEGVTNAMICDAAPDDLSALQSYAVKGVVAEASGREKRVYPPIGETKYRVTLID